MAGLAPLRPTEIVAWARLMRVAPLHPFEVEALMILDDAMFGGTGTEPGTEDSSTLQKTRIQRPWPTRPPGQEES